VSDGDREASTMRMPWPTWGCCAVRKEIGWGRPFGYWQARCANYLAVCVLVEEKLRSSFVRTLLSILISCLPQYSLPSLSICPHIVNILYSF